MGTASDVHSDQGESLAEVVRELGLGETISEVGR